MHIKELGKLTRIYLHNITKLSLLESDLGFYSVEWKQRETIEKINKLQKDQQEIKKQLTYLSPNIIFD